jgi:hypothetical protein
MIIDLTDDEAVFVLERTRLVISTLKLLDRHRVNVRMPAVYPKRIAMLESLASKLAEVVDSLPAPPPYTDYVMGNRNTTLER